jgi:FixJ family two-component response regulator
MNDAPAVRESNGAELRNWSAYVCERITRERADKMLWIQRGNQLRAERARETSKLIAIVDDDDAMQDSLRDLMEAAGLVARCFGSAEEFLESGLHRQAACLITDILMPKMSGLELQTRLKEEECDIPIIFITAYGDARIRIQAMRDGAVEFLAKPFDHHLLLKTVRAALDCEQTGS